MKKISYNILILFVLTVLFTSCETTNLELQDNPTALTPDSANPDYIFNSMLLSLSSQHMALSSMSAPLVRHVNMFGTYNNNVSVSSMNSSWIATYSLMNNLKLLEQISEEKDLAHHVGVAKILNAFMLVNLVDYMGVATYSEAVNTDFPMPGLDTGESIYAEMYLLIDEGIALLNQTASYTHNDGFYQGDLVKWKKLANSLKIKMLVQSRKANGFDVVSASNEINQIVSSGMYLQDMSDDLEIKFGNNETNPDTRHPNFVSNM